MASKHTATRELIKLGVFENLTSFKQFEDRGKKLPNTKLLGDYLEILVEGLLYTHPYFNAKNVWQVGYVPARILKKYNFPLHKTMGLDGVYEDQYGRIIPYQVKNYSCDVLSVEHVATFLGVTEKSLQDRVIFTNVPRFAKEIDRRLGLRGVKAGFFQTLTKDDFIKFYNWLMDKPILPTKERKPRPHQTEFVASAVKGFLSKDRGQAIAACGSGKTLSALWIAEKMWRDGHLPNNTVMVLLPSISLVSQTRKEWNAQLPKDIVELCVCSDETAGKQDDSIQYNVRDMMFPATTDPKIIRKFIKHKTNKMKVIFSTYHSANVVANAMKVRGVKAIDLGIFDEAHRTASTGSMFSFALSNSNIHINKRLFMTATPKHYKISKERLAKLGDDIKIVSMDNEKIYGPVVYRLTFKEAVERGLIVPLKVIVSVVTKAEVAEWIQDKDAATNVKGEDINVKWAAAQIAHAQARKKYGITKSISYLSRIAQAEDYASDTPRGLKNYVDKNVETYCASSNQNSSEREAELRAFAEAPYADIANARCLTEGVDLPSVDMVMFVHPRKSHIDIVQAIGRPMRTAPGKKFGYVLVPLYVDQQAQETFEEAVERTAQDGLVDIINAVREHDEDLTAIIQQLRRERGEGKPYNPRILKDKIEFIGARVKLDTLKKCVTTMIVDRLTTTWDEMYGALKAYQAKHGKGTFPNRSV
jgi:predicted helicase